MKPLLPQCCFLYRGRTPMSLAVVPVGNMFGTKSSSFSHVKITKPKPKRRKKSHRDVFRHQQPPTQVFSCKYWKIIQSSFLKNICERLLLFRSLPNVYNGKFLVINHFCKKNAITDVTQVSKYHSDLT